MRKILQTYAGSLQADQSIKDAVFAVSLIVFIYLFSFVSGIAEGVHHFLHDHAEANGIIVGLIIINLVGTWWGYRRWVEVSHQASTSKEMNHKLKHLINEQKKSTQALIQSEKRLSGILEIAPQAIIVTDESLDIELFNKGATDIFGYEAEEMIGQSAEKLIPERFRSGHGNHVSNFQANRDVRRFMVERASALKGLHKDGTVFPVMASISKVDLEDKTFFAVILQDITQIQARENELKQAKEEAEQANRVKSSFLASMSHEIRTPMNGVLGMAAHLLKMELPEKHREYISLIKNSGEDLLQIINDILDLSKIEAGALEVESIEFDIENMLKNVNRFWQVKCEEKGLSLNVEPIEGHIPLLSGDPSRIKQILNNLIDNAIKFTSSGGVTITPVFEETFEKDKLFIRFQVKDTGVGINQAAQPILFDKFTQADSSITRTYGGTGLGLAICKHLAELMGGEIGFETEEGKGTTFWFTVSCHVTEAEKEKIYGFNVIDFDPRPLSKDLLPNRPNVNILIVEDDFANQMVFKAIFETEGYQFTIAKNGLEAIDVLKEGEFDLVLMDIHMPIMDGMEATSTIRALPCPKKDIPIIATSASTMAGDQEKYLKIGMSDFISKPIDQDKLIALITKYSPQRCHEETTTMVNSSTHS